MFPPVVDEDVDVVCVCVWVVSLLAVPPVVSPVASPPVESPVESVAELSPVVSLELESVVLVEEVVLFVETVAVGGVATPVVGTVSAGAPLVFVSLPLPPLPHAAIASAAMTASTPAMSVR